MPVCRSEKLQNAVNVPMGLPHPKDLTLNNAKRTVPCQLFNMMVRVTGATENFTDEGFLPLHEGKERKVLNLCQDVMHIAHRGRLFLPNQVFLRMTLRHINGSSDIIQLLNGYGLCQSYAKVFEHDTALALQEEFGSSRLSKGKICLSCL